MGRRRFTIGLELMKADDRIGSAINKAKQEMYEGSAYCLTAVGAQSLLRGMPDIISELCVGVVKGYSSIIRSQDIDQIHAFIVSKQQEILKLTSPQEIEPSNAYTNEGGSSMSIELLYSEDYGTLAREFKDKMKIIHQRIDNEFLRDRSKRRETWIPFLVSNALSIIALIISIYGVVNG